MYVCIKRSALLLFLHLLHLIEETINIIMLLYEVLGEFSEPVEYPQAEDYDDDTKYINYIHISFITICPAVDNNVC